MRHLASEIKYESAKPKKRRKGTYNVAADSSSLLTTIFLFHACSIQISKWTKDPLDIYKRFSLLDIKIFNSKRKEIFKHIPYVSFFLC